LFDLGLQELIVIFIVALLVVGPKKLPELARTLGKWITEIRRGFYHAKAQMETEFHEIEKNQLGDIDNMIPKEIKISENVSDNKKTSDINEVSPKEDDHEDNDEDDHEDDDEDEMSENDLDQKDADNIHEVPTEEEKEAEENKTDHNDTNDMNKESLNKESITENESDNKKSGKDVLDG
jgi:sec-independent protein translocase protein TatB